DEEVGLVYFGERYLVPRLGRWATPDPLHVHAVGGGEALNSYHYVSGNLLAARDPLGLDVEDSVLAFFEELGLAGAMSVTPIPGVSVGGALEAWSAVANEGVPWYERLHRAARFASPAYALGSSMVDLGGDVLRNVQRASDAPTAAQRDAALGSAIAQTTILVFAAASLFSRGPVQRGGRPGGGAGGGEAPHAGGGGPRGEGPGGAVRQTQGNSCGPACGEMASTRAGRPASQRSLIDWLTSGEGIGRPQLARAMNVLSEVVGRVWRHGNADPSATASGTLAQLRGIVAASAEGTTIVQLRLGGQQGNQWTTPYNHWVVLEEVGEASVRVRDPARGMVTMAAEEFHRVWNGDWIGLGRATE
ncbi:MAG TPA: RHS repeat-associated core domain-containing protein, partial [Tepidiformaceae bacterium]|nr:RHS repeat-associated core domain-containing protein [Tepidiformaceae bacterium]